MSFQNVSSIRLQEAVREQITDAIRSGEYHPGDKLPSETEFSETLGVSRVSVREALRWLEATGITETRRGLGSFVARGPSESYRSPFSDWLEIHRDEVLDLMRVRGALDELAATEAAVRGTPPTLAAIREAQEAFREAVSQSPLRVGDLVNADVGFHMAIARASGSALLPNLLEDLNKLLTRSRNVVFSFDGRAAVSCREHDAIVEAITTGDPERARSVVAFHVDSTRRALAGDDERPEHAVIPTASRETTAAMRHPKTRRQSRTTTSTK